MAAIARRKLLAAFAGAAAWSLAARAQQAMPVIGWLSSGLRDSDDHLRLPGFRLGLSETGYAEGRNVVIEYRRAEDQSERLPALAADLAGRQVSLILAAGSPASALAAKSVTTSIPIVFDNSADPVQIGLVSSLNRPGGNVTGVTRTVIGDGKGPYSFWVKRGGLTYVTIRGRAQHSRRADRWRAGHSSGYGGSLRAAEGFAIGEPGMLGEKLQFTGGMSGEELLQEQPAEQG